VGNCKKRYRFYSNLQFYLTVFLSVNSYLSHTKGCQLRK
jgi:hypothetical protein